MENFFEGLLSSASETGVQMILKALGAIIVLFVGFRLIRWITRFAARSSMAKRMDPTASSFLGSALSIGLKMVLIIAVCGIVGIPTASIIAVLGSAGVAVGLAMQGSLSNFAGGVMILLFRPFVKGDYIEIPNSEAGTVEDISIFYTTLMTPDNRKVVIPNGTVSNATLTNYSATPRRRVDLVFSAAYEADIDQVRRCILEAAVKSPAILSDPAPDVVLKELGDSSVQYLFRGWCDPKDYLATTFEIRENVKRSFDGAGVPIPYPQLDVHMK